MTYQGARARPQTDETRHVFAISKIRLDESAKVTDVLWCEINAKSNLDMGPAVAVPVAEVIDALHDGARVAAVFPPSFGSLADHGFEVVEHLDGKETIDLVALTDSDPERRARLSDLARMDD